MKLINLSTKLHYERLDKVLEYTLFRGDENLSREEIRSRCEQQIRRCDYYLNNQLKKQETGDFSATGHIQFPFAVINDTIVMDFSMQTRNRWTQFDDGGTDVIFSDGVFVGSKRKAVNDFKRGCELIMEKYAPTNNEVESTILNSNTSLLPARNSLKDTEPTGL